MNEIIEHEELESNPEFAASVLVSKLSERLQEGKSADLTILDVDGTVYEKTKNEEGNWQKHGDNTATSGILEQENIPLVLCTGRPDWNEKADNEMQGLNLSSADAVIAGAGSIIYLRTPDGRLELSRDFDKIQREQKISYQYNDQKVDTIYDPELIANILNNQLTQYQGFAGCRVDTNASIGYATIDVEKIPFDELSKMLREINSSIEGVKTTPSENAEDINDEYFTGWIMVLPASAGKDKAVRFLMEQTANTINPAKIDQKKPTAHTVGDATIDIWMLSLGTGSKDDYNIKGYGLGNLTPLATKRLKKLSNAFALNDEERQQILADIDAQTIEQQTAQLRQQLLTGNDEEKAAASDQLRKISVVQDPNRRRADFRIIEQSGPNGVLEVVKNI